MIMNKKLLTYAFNSEKKLVYIDSVKNGLECGCICPGCKENLVAKNDGKIREHHFSHKSNTDCVSGFQTMIHLLAKDIIFETKLLPLAQNGRLIVVSDVKLEVNLEKLKIIPDILSTVYLLLNNQITIPVPFIVEIYVTHKVEEEKANVIKNAGIPAVEIDLSNSTASTKEQLFQEIYNPKNWKIINKDIGSQFLPRSQIPVTALLNAYRAACVQPSHTNSRNQFYRRNYRKR